jgi:hypothetical protein
LRGSQQPQAELLLPPGSPFFTKRPAFTQYPQDFGHPALAKPEEQLRSGLGVWRKRQVRRFPEGLHWIEKIGGQTVLGGNNGCTAPPEHQGQDNDPSADTCQHAKSLLSPE